MKKSILFKEFLLLIVTIIWGLAFVFQSIGGKQIDTYTLNFLRNLVASIFLFFVCLISLFIKKKNKTYQKEKNVKRLLKAGVLIGVALSVAMTLQQIGINSEGSGKSGFLTALYIVFVPILSLFLGNKLNPLILIALVFGLTGLILINNGVEGIEFSKGSWFLLGSAFAYSVQILLINHYSPEFDTFELSFLEFFSATLILLPFSIIFGKWDKESIINGLPSIIFLGACSSGIAYTIQIYAQKEVNVAVASIIMALESVFSLIFGFLLLNERYNVIQLLGCISIFIAVILSQLPYEKFNKKAKKKN